MADKILIADDDPQIRRLLRGYLEDAGFQVLAAADGREAVALAAAEGPDLIILDLAMPELDGWETARRLRRRSDVPIIFLTARVDEADRVAGLEMGADDYVTKPFSPREVAARVRAVLRRARGAGAEPRLLRRGQLSLDPEGRQAFLAGQELTLTRTEFDLLAALMERPGRAFSRMELLERVQEEAFAGYERTIDGHIKNLRRKIGDDPRQPTYIETVYGIGYRLRRVNDE